MAAGAASDGELPALADIAVGGGRELPDLLFVTNRTLLARNIGQRESELVLGALRRAGVRLFDEVPRGWQAAVATVTALLRNAAEIRGVVLLGGYDVVPSHRVDCLPRALRKRLTRNDDADDFVVWNDDAYGDLAARGALGDIPVSRIPDARSARLMVAAIQAAPTPEVRRQGVRNVARPFAEQIFLRLPGHDDMLVSEPATASGVPAVVLDAPYIYLMLHGEWYDGTRFWGENTPGGVEAVNIGSVSDHCPAVVFAGCCWGALSVDRPASRVDGDRRWGFGPKTAESSMALSFLLAGATAFVGCTGSHYSPKDPPFHYFGGPMHEAFWERCLAGTPPARALLDAKWHYASYMPHGQSKPALAAIEYKILREFTCLGLGW